MTNILVAGKPDTGKTTFVREKLAEDAEAVGAVLILDTKGHDYPNTPRVQDPDQFREAVEQGHERVRWCPRNAGFRDEQCEEVVNRFLEGVDRVSMVRPVVTAIIEEAKRFQVHNHVYPDHLSLMMTEGDSHGVNIVQVTQFPKHIASESFSGISKVYTFHVGDELKRLVKEDFLSAENRDPDDDGPTEKEQVHRWVSHQYHHAVLRDSMWDDPELREPIDL